MCSWLSLFLPNHYWATLSTIRRRTMLEILFHATYSCICKPNQPTNSLQNLCVCEIYLVELIILDTTKTVVCSLIRLIKWLSHPGAWHGLICPGLSDGFSFGIPLFVPQGPFLHTYLRLWPQDSGETGLLHKHLLPGNIFGKPYFHVPRA